MALSPKSVSSPKWSNAEHTTIDCLVVFERPDGTLTEVRPFTATQNDTEAYTNSIYIAALAQGPAPYAPPAPPTPTVPEEVTLWQVRAILEQRGLFGQVDGAIVALNDPVVSAIWQYGNVIRRDSSTLAKIGLICGLTSAQLDDLAIAANALTL